MPNLNSFPIFLSASVPQHLVGTNKAQSMLDLMVALVGGILSSSGTLIFGGHPSITPLIHRVASLVGVDTPQIQLFQLNRFRDSIPQEVNDSRIFQKVAWIGESKNTKATLAAELEQMRVAMVKEAGAGIFIGGKTEQYVGNKPGIRDEYEKFLEYSAESPIYLVGMFEGETLNIINDSNEQLRRNKLNSLHEEEISILQSSNNIDLIASIILRDLHRQAEQQKQ
jgi:hypothetical protein